MIKINLLPPEKRKAERTPVSRFAFILVDVVAAMLILAYLATVVLKIWDTEQQIQDAQARLASLQKDVEQYERLEKEHAQLQAKVREIDGITRRDVEWWEAINAVWDVIHQNPKVWIDDLKILDDRAAATDIKKMDGQTNLQPLYGVAMRCHVGGNEVSEMTRFRTDLKNNPVLNRLLPLLNFDVDWRVEEEKDAGEQYSLSFNVALYGFTKPTASTTTPDPAPAAKGGPQ